MKTSPLIVLLVFSIMGQGLMSQSWQSSLLSLDSDGSIEYFEDGDGYILPDFSHAGYLGGGEDIPDVKVLIEISPVPGDNTGHIQDAINQAGTLAINNEGIRGAVLLKAGRYDIYGTINVKHQGVVLRGEGQGSDSLNSTILYARGDSPHQRDVIIMGSASRISGTSQISGTKTFITDEVVPVGSFSFQVENASFFEPGDRIIIYHPATQDWIEAVDLGGVPFPDPGAPENPDERWKEGQLPILYNRYITKIEGNRISTDAPVFYSLHKSLSESYVYKPDMQGLVSHIGLENLRVDIETSGGEDEDHAWQAVRFKSCENAWARNCTFIHFGQSGIITEACSRSTFSDCSAIDPVAIITGSRMYNFNTYHYSQLNLFENCYASNGRHHYVSNGTSTTSGNVFLRCISDAANSVNEGHRQWTQGMLYDNHKEINLKRDFVLGLYNRVAMGTGHGWAAVHSVLWNCDVDESYGKIALQKPPTGQNYAIGCLAKIITGNPISASDFTLGFVEGQNSPGLEPNSIYEAQLTDRKNYTGVHSFLSGGEMKVYPTRVKDELHIRFDKNRGKKRIKVYTLTGSLIMEFEMKENYKVIQTSRLVKGIYLIECKSDEEIYSSKFIKE